MAKIIDKSKVIENLQMALLDEKRPEIEARKWLDKTSHRDGCQCHHCHWAHGVLAGRIQVDFATWRGQ